MTDLQNLRQRAEASFVQMPENIESLSPEEIRKVLHELRVHQIELEMQNEELRMAQVNLDVSRERYFDLYDLAPVAYCTANSKGTIIEANLATTTMLGATRMQLVCTPFSRFILKEDQERYYFLSECLFKTGKPQVVELRMVKKDGTTFWVNLDAIANAATCRIVITDITERKQKQESLRMLMLELERSNNDLEQFAFVASHDLREPLRMVSSYTQLLAERYEGQFDEKARTYMGYVVDGVARMNGLVSDLLTFARIGAQGLTMERINLQHMLGVVLRGLQATITEQKAVVTADQLPVVEADATLLAQVFQNLIANAVKFHGASPPCVHVAAREDGGELVFSVRDNGIGIDRQYAEQIFKIFRRLNTRQEYDGNGIGLSICKRIVERHGGRIWLESEVGKGSTFFFTIIRKEYQSSPRKNAVNT